MNNNNPDSKYGYVPLQRGFAYGPQGQDIEAVKDAKVQNAKVQNVVNKNLYIVIIITTIYNGNYA